MASPKLFASPGFERPHRLVFFVLLLLSGCATVHQDFRVYTPEAQQLVATQVEAAVVLPESLCSLYYDNGNLTAFDLGPVVCKNARIAAGQAFSNVSFHSDPDSVKQGGVDVIGILKPGIVKTRGTRVIPATVYADVDLRWEFRTADGSRRYSSVVRGHGEDQRTFGTADTRYEATMQRCMDDLARNLQREMAGAYEKAEKNFRATRVVRSIVDSLQVGKSSYEDYRAAKSDDLRVFALDEHVSYRGAQYLYVNEPEANRHLSTMGSCTTRWLKPWPVIEPLRPSVYLTEGSIDLSKLSGIHIKESVGSRYDGHPLCELVLDGEGFDSALLTKRSCEKDYTTSEAYLSSGEEAVSGLAETARNWLKLRVGMSKREISEQIGVPSVIVQSTLSGGMLEYGHGRIRLDGDERLLYWQLRELPPPLSPVARKDVPGPSVMRWDVVGAPGLGGRQAPTDCLPD